MDQLNFNLAKIIEERVKENPDKIALIIPRSNENKKTDTYVNGGYFVIEPEFFDWIAGDNTFLEREPLVKASLAGELMAYQHHGFWHCMDTKRDHESLEKLWEQGAPWRR